MASFNKSDLRVTNETLQWSLCARPTQEQHSQFASVLNEHPVKVVRFSVSEDLQEFVQEYPQLTESLQSTVSLVELYLQGVVFKTESEIDKLVRIIKNNPHLNRLTLDATVINENTMIKIAAAIDGHPAFSQLKYNVNRCEGHFYLTVEKGRSSALDKALYELIDYMIPCPQALLLNFHLVELRLMDFRGRDDYMILFAAALANNTSLNILYIKNGDLLDESGEALAQALEKNNSLSYLNLSHNRFTDKTGKFFAKAITINFSLKKLNLSGNPFTKAMTEIFAEAVKYSAIHAIDIDFLPKPITREEPITGEDLFEMFELMENFYFGMPTPKPISLLDDRIIKKLQDNKHNFQLMSTSLIQRLLKI